MGVTFFDAVLCRWIQFVDFVFFQTSSGSCECSYLVEILVIRDTGFQFRWNSKPCIERMLACCRRLADAHVGRATSSKVFQRLLHWYYVNVKGTNKCTRNWPPEDLISSAVSGSLFVTFNFTPWRTKSRMDVDQRPIVYFDINIGDKPTGRVIFSLFSDLVPKTAENFRQSWVDDFGLNRQLTA